MKKLFSLALVAASLAPLAPSAHAAEYSAKFCEVSIDALRLTRSSHALTRVEVLVKIRPEALDGAVKRVALYGVRKGLWTAYPNNPGYMDNGPFEIELVPYFGAKDYFTVGQSALTLGHDWGAWEYEVTPYVETDKGTRYFANTLSGGNFKLNFDLAHILEEVQQDIYSYETRAVSTQNSRLAAYNPYGCR